MTTKSLAALLAEPGIIAAPAPLIADGDNGHGGPLLAVTRRLEDIYATLLKGEGLPPSDARVTFQRYNEIVGLPELLASAARLEDETK